MPLRVYFCLAAFVMRRKFVPMIAFSFSYPCMFRNPVDARELVQEIGFLVAIYYKYYDWLFQREKRREKAFSTQFQKFLLYVKCEYEPGKNCRSTYIRWGKLHVGTYSSSGHTCTYSLGLTNGPENSHLAPGALCVGYNYCGGGTRPRIKPTFHSATPDSALKKGNRKRLPLFFSLARLIQGWMANFPTPNFQVFI